MTLIERTTHPTRIHHDRRWFVGPLPTLVALVFAGCGATDDTAQASGASESTDDMGTDDEGESESETGDVPSAEDTTDGSDTGCELDEDPPAEADLQFTVRNETDRVQFLIPADVFLCDFQLLRLSDELGAVHWDGGQSPESFQTCDEQLCFTGCPDDRVGAIALAPGHEWTVNWQGSYYERVLIDPWCHGEIACPVELSVSCEVRRTFDAPEIGVTVRHTETCPTRDGPECNCDSTCEFSLDRQDIPVDDPIDTTRPLPFPDGGIVVLEKDDDDDDDDDD